VIQRPVDILINTFDLLVASCDGDFNVSDVVMQCFQSEDLIT